MFNDIKYDILALAILEKNNTIPSKQRVFISILGDIRYTYRLEKISGINRYKNKNGERPQPDKKLLYKQ